MVGDQATFSVKDLRYHISLAKKWLHALSEVLINNFLHYSTFTGHYLGALFIENGIYCCIYKKILEKKSCHYKNGLKFSLYEVCSQIKRTLFFYLLFNLVPFKALFQMAFLLLLYKASLKSEMPSIAFNKFIFVSPMVSKRHPISTDFRQ